MSDSWLWAVFTIIAAAAQTVRNAAQRELTGTLGTVGATHVRFLFGFPFALLFLAGIALASGAPLPRFDLRFVPWVLGGALAQIVATALMLAAMTGQSFVVTIAYTKTEPIQVALFGVVFLGDAVTAPVALAILVATAGVLTMSPNLRVRGPRLRAMLLGLVAGGCFALSAVGYRGAILALHDPDFVIAATFTVAVGLMIQSVLLTSYLWLRDRPVLTAILRAWRPSLFAGFMGALASQFWVLGFATATAASVRTLALVEVLFAQAVSRIAFGQRASRREVVGIVLIVAGVVLLLWAY